MKVLLTAINAKYIHSNLAVYSLRAYAARYRDETAIAEYTINQEIDGILVDIYRQKPDILCFSCYLWNIIYVRQLIIEIHKILPGVHIWLGGPEVSYNAPEMLRQFPQIQGIMRGEGEETFLDLLKYFHGEIEKIEDIDGITFRDSQNRIVENTDRPVLDLSKVPFVYEHIEDFENKILYYETSRGCPFSCSYCLSSIDKCLRFRSMDLVKAELQFFIDHEVPQVKFVDRTFNCRHDHAMEIWTYLAEHDRGITNFHFEIAADLINEKELKLLNSLRPGLVQLEIGVQSTNQDTIREIHRIMDFGMVEKVVNKVASTGNIHQHLDLIAGLPFENYESFKNSFNDVYGLHPEQLQLGFLKVLKGSRMHENTENYDLKYQDRPPFEVLSTKWLSYAEIVRLKKIEDMVEVHYNSGQFVNTMKLLESDFADSFTMYEALADYYEKNNLHQVNHSRIARYEILYQFVCGINPQKKEQYRQMLTLDLYLRENVKNRPWFAGEPTVERKEESMFYEREAEEHQYLKDYAQYDKRSMRKMTHMEKINGRIMLFDYKNRSRLTNEAKVYFVGTKDETDTLQKEDKKYRM